MSCIENTELTLTQMGLVTVTREPGEWRMSATWYGDTTPVAEATTTALDPTDDTDQFIASLPEGLWDTEFERIPGEDDD